MKTHLTNPTPPLIPQRQYSLQDKKAFIKNKMRTERQLFRVMAIDILLLNLSLLAFILLKIPLSTLVTEHLWSVFIFFLGVNLIGFLGAPFTEIYQIAEGIKLKLNIRALFVGCLIYFGIIDIIYNQVLPTDIKTNFLFLAFFCFFILSSINHFLFRYYNKQHPMLLTYAVIGGKQRNLRYLTDVFKSAYGENTFCVGRFAKDEVQGMVNLGDYLSVEDYLKNSAEHINKLVYFYSDLTKNEVQRIIQLCRSRFIDFEVVPTGIDFFEKGVQVEQLAHLPIFRRGVEPLCRIENKVLKRVFDIVFSLLVIFFIFPWLFPIVALLITLESRGPIFFIQKRTGYWNKPFNCIKFRTMKVNSRSDQQQATKEDARITKWGAFLRKTNIDELPQFFNVLKGDMSVVGPRPHMLKHTEDYSKLIDKFMIRHEVKPGITGWAQVKGWRGPTEVLYKMAKRVEYDVDYIENWSFWFDCKCILLTVYNIFKGEKNAF